jgi:hypothetical protein
MLVLLSTFENNVVAPGRHGGQSSDERGRGDGPEPTGPQSRQRDDPPVAACRRHFT